MIGELERMLHMLPAQSSWEIPVLATQASNDVGVAALLDAIHNHREHRRARVEPERLRQARRREVYDIVEEELAARLRSSMNQSTFQDILVRVDRGESDPYGAAGEILEDRMRLSTVLASDRRDR